MYPPLGNSIFVFLPWAESPSSQTFAFLEQSGRSSRFRKSAYKYCSDADSLQDDIHFTLCHRTRIIKAKSWLELCFRHTWCTFCDPTLATLPILCHAMQRALSDKMAGAVDCVMFLNNDARTSALLHFAATDRKESYEFRTRYLLHGRHGLGVRSRRYLPKLEKKSRY